MDYNRYGHVGAPTTEGGCSRPPLSSFPSNQSYFILEPENRAPTHLSLSSYTPATSSLPSVTLPRDHFEPLGTHMSGTHLGDMGERPILSSYQFREPGGRSMREYHREHIGVSLWNPITEPRDQQDAVRRQLIMRGLQWELAPRNQDRISSRAPRDRDRDRVSSRAPRDRDRVSSRAAVHQHRSQRQQIPARNNDETTSSTARMEAQLQRITRALEKDGKLLERDDDNNSVPARSEHKHVRPEKEVLQDEGNKTKDNQRAVKIPELPGWCSLCNVDCVTKEVLHKCHAYGKKHQSMLKKLEDVSTDGKKSLQLLGWCSLCEVDCKTMEALYGEHRLSEKHQLLLGIQQKPQIKQHDKVQEMDNSSGKRKQQVEMNEEGSISSQKRQKLPVLSFKCKICNKEFNSQVVLDSHLSGKKHAAQLKKLGNSAAPLEVNSDQNRKCTNVDGHEPKNSKLVVLSKDDAKAGGKEEITSLEVKDDGVGVKAENDDSKDIAEPREVDFNKENTPAGKVEEVAKNDQNNDQ